MSIYDSSIQEIMSTIVKTLYLKELILGSCFPVYVFVSMHGCLNVEKLMLSECMCESRLYGVCVGGGENDRVSD